MTLKSRWENFVSCDHYYKTEDPDFRRAYLINIVLILIPISGCIFIITNVFFTGFLLLAAFEAVWAITSCILLFSFRRKRKIEQAAIGAVILLLVFLAVFFFLFEYRYYTFIILCFVPMVSFFLLGIFRGIITLIVVFVCTTLFMLSSINDWQLMPFNWLSIFNILSVYILCSLFVYFYENSLQKALVTIKKQNNQLFEQANKDALTNIYNRRRLNETLSEYREYHKIHRKQFSVVILDIDKFKKINDTYGHNVGDSVLKEVSELIRANIRTNDILGRWGGEEFMLVLAETTMEEAALVAENLRALLDNHHFNSVGSVSASFGIASCDQQDNMEHLVNQADQALYTAKERGRNRVEVFNVT